MSTMTNTTAITEKTRELCQTILDDPAIKSAHDLKLPMVAVGLLWARGYCVQRIGADGRPYEEFPGYTADWLEDTGVRVRVRVRGVEVQCRIWVTQRFGHRRL